MLVSKHVVMDETKPPAIAKQHRIHQLLMRILKKIERSICEVKCTRIRLIMTTQHKGASDVSNSRPLRITESLDVECDLAAPDDDHVETRRYPEKNRVTPEQLAFAARKVSGMDMPSVKEAMDFGDRDEWERVVKLEMKTL